ncbi:MAG: hypothetical protein GXO47_06720 [Chlorobi bacterium]|nr:hypothetical protein [Chlorobiota bacterium]
MKDKISPGLILFMFLFLLFIPQGVKSQYFEFELKTGNDLNFDFNTIDKYVNGITILNACVLNVRSDSLQWDLYVSATKSEWDVEEEYSNIGETPPIDIVFLKFRNASRTPLIDDFFPLPDPSNPVYLIGSENSSDSAIDCPGDGTNKPGNYLDDPSCYKFNVDVKIVPGLDPVYKSGKYTLTIEYVLMENL